MKELIVFMASAGPNVCRKNIEETCQTFIKNLGDVSYDLYVVVDKSETETFVKELLKDSLIEVAYSEGPWAYDFNKFMGKYCRPDMYNYLAIIQDDILVDSPDFYRKTLKGIEGHEDKVAWITYTNTHFHQVNASNSVRGGIYTDRAKFDAFECHLNNGKLDYPTGPVVVYGPFSHFNMIKTDNMLKVGPCANFGPYVMLVDEDWSLEALTKGFVNVWIPDVFYRHPNPNQAAMRKGDLRFREEAHKAFKMKWGFNQEPTDSEIAWLLNKYPGLAYLHRDSYDWIYLNSTDGRVADLR